MVTLTLGERDGTGHPSLEGVLSCPVTAPGQCPALSRDVPLFRAARGGVERAVAILRASGEVDTTLLDRWWRADGRLVVHRVGLHVERARGSRDLRVFHVDCGQHLDVGTTTAESVPTLESGGEA